MTAPLDGIRVLDLTHTIAGPYCTMTLGDLGADVIKVEPLAGDAFRQGSPVVKGVGYYFLLMNRNKRSLALDSKSDIGREVLARLAARADVIVENFRPGAAERLGLGYAQLARKYERLVYCSISGFGQDGPARDLPAYDLILQGMGGLLSYNRGEDGRPRVFGIPLADLAAGMNAVQGTLAALFARERSGRGQQVDTSLLEGAVGLSSWMAALYLGLGYVGSFADKERFLVPYGIFRASDADFVLQVTHDGEFRRLCEALGKIEWAEDPRFTTKEARRENREALLDPLTALFASEPQAHWLALLERARIPAGPIHDIARVLSDPQVEHRNLVEEIDYPPLGRARILGLPIKLSETPPKIRRPPPQLGEHSAEVLRELGYEPARIEAMRAERLVGAG